VAEAPLFWAAALRCRCPRCGVGQLYTGLFTMRPACPECGLDLTELNTGVGAAWAVIQMLVAAVLAAVFWVEFRFNLPVWVNLVMRPTVILLMRSFKAALIIQHYRHRVAEMGL